MEQIKAHSGTKLDMRNCVWYAPHQGFSHMNNSNHATCESSDDILQ